MTQKHYVSWQSHVRDMKRDGDIVKKRDIASEPRRLQSFSETLYAVYACEIHQRVYIRKPFSFNEATDYWLWSRAWEDAIGMLSVTARSPRHRTA